MVKGISRRVIVVRTPDPRFLNRRYFFLREDVFHREGVTDEQVLSEARQVAAGISAAAARRRLRPGNALCPPAPAGAPWARRRPASSGAAFAAVTLLVPKAERGACICRRPDLLKRFPTARFLRPSREAFFVLNTLACYHAKSCSSFGGILANIAAGAGCIWKN